MAKRFLIVLIISVICSSRAGSQVKDTDAQLRSLVSRYGQAEVTVPYSGRKSIDYITTNVSILSVRDNTVYISLSPRTVEWFISQKFRYRLVENNPVDVFSARGISQTMDWDKYPTYTGYDSIMRSFPRLYPALCKLDTIGTSVNGRLVLALKITSNHNAKPSVFYTSTMHGDETGGFMLMLHLADYLVKNYSVSGRVKNLVDSLEIWINPLANPDGAYRSGNTISSPVRYNANGFDLNRNFPDSFTPETEKQKETLDMIKFMRKHRFVLSANFHSGVEVVNYPWDRWLSKFHADDSWFNRISRAYADTAHVYGGQAYMNFLDNGVTRGSEWYVVYGGRQDFVTGELNGREVTIELDDQYVTPEAQLTLLWQNNWRSLMGYLENALFGIHGKVLDSNSHVPIPARIFIKGHDKDSSHVYSDTLSGNFVRFLSPGSWNLTFSAAGYRDTTINNIMVTNRQRTDLIVDMSPVVDEVKSPDFQTSVILYPNPASSTIKAVLPDSVSGSVRVRIINHTGKLVAEYKSVAVHGVPLTIDVSTFPSGIYTIVFSTSSATYHGRLVVIK